MTTVIFEYNGKSKEIPIDEIKSVNDVADAYATLGLKTKQPIKRRLYYTLPNGNIIASYLIRITSMRLLVQEKILD